MKYPVLAGSEVSFQFAPTRGAGVEDILRQDPDIIMFVRPTRERELRPCFVCEISGSRWFAPHGGREL